MTDHEIGMAPAVKGLTSQCEMWKQVVAALTVEVQEIKAERDALRAFAHDLTKDWPHEIGIDGFDLQDLLVKHGLIAEKSPKPTEPCAQGACNCASYYAPDEWAGGVVCYGRTDLLRGPLTPVCGARCDNPARCEPSLNYCVEADAMSGPA